VDQTPLTPPANTALARLYMVYGDNDLLNRVAGQWECVVSSTSDARHAVYPHPPPPATAPIDSGIKGLALNDT